MQSSVSIFYDVVCPYAYLASTQIRHVADAAGATLTWRPMLLGGVFRAIGTPDVPATALAPSRVRWNALDIERSAARLGVTLRMPSAHPRRTVEAMRLLTAARLDAPDRLEGLTHALYRAYWVDGLDIADRAVLAGLADAHGVKLARIDDDDTKLALRDMTAEAVKEGVFGAPSFIVDGPAGRRMIFGSDRLHFVARLLRGETGRAETPARVPSATPGRPLTFLFDFSSPYTYLAATQIERVAAEARAPLTWTPIFLGGLFKDIGSPLVPIAVAPEARRRQLLADTQDWAAYWGVPFRWPSRFPIMTVTALRMALAAGANLPRFAHAVFRAFWAEDRDINDKATLMEIAGSVGLDGAGLLEQAGAPEIKSRLAENTSQAARDGSFGLPTFLVGGPQQIGATSDTAVELHFGQDRLDFVRAALAMPAR